MQKIAYDVVMENATTFGAQASTYAAARPSYPDELFDWIAAQAPAKNHVWDVGTGSGQAARALADRFEHVHATDIDTAQIKAATPQPNITYTPAEAHASGLADNSVDAITVATALHWFDMAKFWAEVQRVAKPGAVFCGWTYHRSETDQDVERALIKPVLDLIEPYWSDGNRLSWRGYFKDELNMPFEELQTPAFECRLMWTPAEIAAFTRSWSAHQKARNDGLQAQLAAIETDALGKLGHEPRPFVMPMHVLAARVE